MLGGGTICAILTNFIIVRNREKSTRANSKVARRFFFFFPLFSFVQQCCARPYASSLPYGAVSLFSCPGCVGAETTVALFEEGNGMGKM